jgi:hypothetical protein
MRLGFTEAELCSPSDRMPGSSYALINDRSLNGISSVSSALTLARSVSNERMIREFASLSSIKSFSFSHQVLAVPGTCK